MTQEVLIPKMKRIDKQQKRIRIPLVNFAVIIFCVLLIISSTFLNIDLKHYILPTDFFSNKDLTANDFIYSFFIIPQIPIIMFICSLVGKRMAITSVILYILTGLFFAPIFALDGGIRYIGEFGFGYILGYIPAVIIAGNFLKNNYSFSNLIKSSILGVLSIHIIGIIYMIIIAIFKHQDWNFISGWRQYQSGVKIIYDIVISFVLMLIGKYLHSALKFILN